MGDEKSKNSTSAFHAIEDIFRKVGDVLEQTSSLVDKAQKTADVTGQRPEVEAKLTVKSMDGAPISISSLTSILNTQNASSTSETSTPSTRSFTQVKLEVVENTQHKFIALVELPGVELEDVTLCTDGEVLKLQAEGVSTNYWSEMFVARDLSKSKPDLTIRHGILTMTWAFSGD